MTDTQTADLANEEAQASAGTETNSANEEKENLDKKDLESEKGKAELSEKEEASNDDAEKFKQSSKEAIRLYKENQSKTQQLSFSNKLVSVAKNPDSIHDIATVDPELADKISNELWEKDYSRDEKKDDGAEPDTTQTVKNEIRNYEQRKVKEAIEDVEESFLIEKGVLPGSDEFKRIMDDYSTFNPKTPKEAKLLLTMSYTTNVKQKDESIKIEGIPATHSGSGSGISASKAAENKSIANSFDIDQKYVDQAERFLTS